MKSTLKIEKCNSAIVNFSMGIVKAEEFDFTIDMERVWPGFIGLNTFQQTTLLYALKQRFSDATGKKDESGSEKQAIIAKLILAHETQKYNTGIRMNSKPGISAEKADIMLGQLNGLGMQTAKAIENNTVNIDMVKGMMALILGEFTLVDVCGSAKGNMIIELENLLDKIGEDISVIMDKVDDLQQEIILHVRKAKAIRAANKAKKEAK